MPTKLPKELLFQLAKHMRYYDMGSMPPVYMNPGRVPVKPKSILFPGCQLVYWGHALQRPLRKWQSYTEEHRKLMGERINKNAQVCP